MQEEFYLKVHKINNELLMAICDKEHLNCNFSHNGIRIHISEHFYGSIGFTTDEVVKKAKQATQINAVGNKIVNLLASKLLISTETILWMKDDSGKKVGHVITIG